MKSNLSNAEVNYLRTELFDTVYEIMENGALIHGIDYVEGHSIAGIWHSSNRVGDDFLKRREAFLWILEQLIKQSRIKLHKKGVFLESPIDEQIAPFRRAFPKNEKDAHQIVFNTDETQCRPSTAIGLWFFLDDCPAGIAWRREDGSYEIAD